MITMVTFIFWCYCSYFIFYCSFASIFQGNSKRLLHLQEAMEIRDVDGLPIEIQVKNEMRLGNWSIVLTEWFVNCETVNNVNRRKNS